MEFFMAIATTNPINSMGIADFATAIAAGMMTRTDVLPILDARIAKRAREGKPAIANVIKYRNEIAAEINQALGMGIPPVPVPTYAKPVATTTGLPTDMADLIAHVKATVPPAEMPAFVVAIVNN
jgi:hypothetical protein